LSVIDLIPVSLYGVDEEKLERFYLELPQLVSDLYEDVEYQAALFSIKSGEILENLRIADELSAYSPYAWPEDIVMEVTMAVGTIKYPDVGLLEHLLTLEEVDATRVSAWLHFISKVYPIYSAKACSTLDRMGIPTPYRPNDIASYGLYITRIEGLKVHAPATGMAEIGLPRARVLQIALERFK
jgi:hypothetical protein